MAERNGFDFRCRCPRGQTVPKQPLWDTFRAKKLKFSGLSLGFKSFLPPISKSRQVEETGILCYQSGSSGLLGTAHSVNGDSGLEIVLTGVAQPPVSSARNQTTPLWGLLWELSIQIPITRCPSVTRARMKRTLVRQELHAYSAIRMVPTKMPIPLLTCKRSLVRVQVRPPNQIPKISFNRGRRTERRQKIHQRASNDSSRLPIREAAHCVPRSVGFGPLLAVACSINAIEPGTIARSNGVVPPPITPRVSGMSLCAFA